MPVVCCITAVIRCYCCCY